MSQLSYKEIIESQLPEYLFKSKDIESQAIGNSLDKLQYGVDILENEVNPLSAVSEGLEQWERFFKLPSNVDENIEIRKVRVVSELIQFMSDENVIRKDEMENILSFYGGNLEVIEFPSEYTFWINYKSLENIDLNMINNVIRQIKPSYLKYLIAYIKSENINIQNQYKKLKINYKLTNRTKTESRKVHSINNNVKLEENYRLIPVKYRLCGRIKAQSVGSDIQEEKLTIQDKYISRRVKYPICNKSICGGGIR